MILTEHKIPTGHKKIFLSLIIGMFLLSSFMLVSSVPPVTQISYYPEGYTIREQQIRTYDLGEPIRYGFFLTNTSSGKTVNDSQVNYCRIVTSDNQGFNTQVSNITYNDTYKLWGIELNESESLRHFSSEGLYNYAVSCQDGKGDVITGIFEVIEEKTGVFNMDLDNSSNLIIMIILFAISILTFIIKRQEISSLIMLILGFFMLINGVNTIASLIIISLGVIIAFIGGDE